MCFASKMMRFASKQMFFVTKKTFFVPKEMFSRLETTFMVTVMNVILKKTEAAVTRRQESVG